MTFKIIAKITEYTSVNYYTDVKKKQKMLRNLVNEYYACAKQSFVLFRVSVLCNSVPKIWFRYLFLIKYCVGILEAPALNCHAISLKPWKVVLQTKQHHNFNRNQRTNGPVNAHLISWPSTAQNIQILEKYVVKK